MKTFKRLYLITFSISRRCSIFGERSVSVSGHSGADALTNFHRVTQRFRNAQGMVLASNEYRVLRMSEIDRKTRAVIARLPFPSGPNPRFSVSADEHAATQKAPAQACFAF